MSDDFTCGLVLLAAGASRRMGRPKQLLPVAGQPMVRHVALAIFAAPLSPRVVVLGAHAKEIIPALAGISMEVVVHADWAKGMGSSLAAGVAAALKLDPQMQGLIIVLADQPWLNERDLGRLLEVRRQTGLGLVASTVDGVLGPPVLFTAAWFPKLLELEGDAGAKSLLEANRAMVATVPFAARIDLDTPEDYENCPARRG